jgi:hypothetical protein
MSREEQSFSIWYVIGILVGVYGLLILGAGIWELKFPPAVPLVLANLHAGIWWGLLLVCFGGFYAYFFRPKKRR